jgi:polysaccharide biosynthesis transport protein
MSNTATAGVAAQAFGDMGLEDYLALVKRRKYWIIFSALAVMITSAVVAWRLPDVYRCQAVILVEPQKVPDNVAHSVVTSGVIERVSRTYQEVTSPASLKRIIDSMDLYADIKKLRGEQEALLVMQNSIKVEPVFAMGTQAAGAFSVTYKGRNPVQTAQVTNQIAARFIEENLKLREESTYGTADFLDAELQKTAQQLQEKENEMAEFRKRYIQDLPETGQFYVQDIENLRMQLHTTEQQITQDQQQKLYLEALASSTAPTVDLDLGAAGSASSPTEDLQAKLNALRSRYGPNHPDVRKLQAQIDEAKAKQVESPAPTTATPAAHKGHSPVIEAQLEQLDEDIEKQKKAAAQLQAELNVHLAKMQNAPIYEQKTGGIQREYDALKGRYMSLLGQKMSIETSTALENREKSERFVLLDTAPVPERPYSPNRPLLLTVGIFLGLLVGFGAGLVRELTDSSVRNEREAERILGTPVLSGVPEILSARQQWQNAFSLCGLALVTVVCAVGIGIGLANFSVRLQ